MNTEYEPTRDQSDDSLYRAIQAVIAQPAPSDIKQCLIETAAAWGTSSSVDGAKQHTLRSVSVTPKSVPSEFGRLDKAASPNLFWRPRVWLLGAAGVVATVTITLLLSRPSESWAQVNEALRTKPWILCKYTSSDGRHYEDWISLSSDVSALRHGESLRFFDHRLNVIYEYNAEEQTITRALDSLAYGKKRADRGFTDLFQQILRGVDKLTFAEPSGKLVEEKRQRVTKLGRAWLSYELAIRVDDVEVGDERQILQLTFLVDPQSRLPHFLLMNQPNMHPPTIQMELSYPETGPIDIYELGVPRDTRIVDLVPTDDLQRVISEIRSSAERFDQHLALTITSYAESPWSVGTPLAVWRKGTSWRMVYGLVDSASPASKAPMSDTDERQWWKDRWTELFHVPAEICNGSTIWNNEGLPAGWRNEPNMPIPLTWRRAAWPQPKWNSRSERSLWSERSPPLVVAYPYNLVNSRAFRWELAMDLYPTDGPPDTVKVILRTGSPGLSARDERFWIDKQRSHMVVRHEVVTPHSSKTTPSEVVIQSETVEKADRSPQGIWYPTLVRHFSVVEQDGEKKMIETMMRHFLEFDVKFTDDLFKPVERPGEPLE